MTTTGGPDDAEMVLESRWRCCVDDEVPVDVDEPVDAAVVLGLWLKDALPGIVSAAMSANTPSAASAPTAIQVVSSLSRSKANSRALIDASVESMVIRYRLMAALEKPESSL